MTRRTTPVGILVVALIGLIAVGCSAPTNAVFQALLDPAGTAAPAPEADPDVDPAPSGGASQWWAHPDGYAMVLPAGWAAMAVAQNGTDELIDLLSDTMPELATRVEDTFAGTETRVSTVAAGPVNEDGSRSMMVVLAEPQDGRKLHAIKSDAHERLKDLHGLSSRLTAQDVALTTGKGFRFDYAVDDPDLGALRVRSYLLRSGRTVYLVNFVASADPTTQEEQWFDLITSSLRFGG